MFNYTIGAIIYKDTIELAVASFDSLVALPQAERRGLESTAVVQRDHLGDVKFVESRFWTARQGAQLGGLLGLVIGAIFSGPIVGLVAGIGIGTLLGNAFGRGLNQEFVDQVQTQLQPGDSALIILLREPNEALLTSFVTESSTLYQTELQIEVTSALRRSLEGYVD
jgi:uncharacterized membrane protein